MAHVPYTPRRPFQSRFLQLRGLRHHLLEWGEARPGQTSLLMLHGWMDVGASFQFVADALPQDWHLLALDWRGFGRSQASGSDAYWFPDYLGDLDALLDALKLDEPIDLLGHSMGGNVVMSYAGLRPARIRKLVNLEGFGLPQTQPAMAPGRLISWLDELKQPQSLRPYPDLAGVALRLMKTNPRLSEDKAQWLAQHWSEHRDGAWHILGDPAHKRTNPVLYRAEEVLACWALIQAPTLWVEGRQTDVNKWWGDRYPRSEFEQRLAVVREVQQLSLEDAGHMLHHDQPEALAQALQRFLSR